MREDVMTEKEESFDPKAEDEKRQEEGHIFDEACYDFYKSQQDPNRKNIL